MAINSFGICDKTTHESHCSSCSSKAGNFAPCHLVKLNLARDGSVFSTTGKRGKLKKNKDSISPYLAGDTVQVISRVTEKSLVHKKGSDFISSFPLAVNIYKANSDEFKILKRGNKKVKKSVLTLPNEATPMPELCTVSDMNDSEYFNRDDNNRKMRNKPRSQVPNRKPRVRNKTNEFYDRDARYCSQLNIDLNCSSTDMIKKINGDGKRVSKIKCKPQDEDNLNPHDVWAVLRNINGFQFRPSPPISDDSILKQKNKKGLKSKNVLKRRNKRKDTRFVETCRTEEFAYISSYGVDSKSPISFSQSSSFDRITVIDKQEDLSKICNAFEKSILKSRTLVKGANNFNKNNNKIKYGITSNKKNSKSKATKETDLQVTLNNGNNYLKNKGIRLNSTTKQCSCIDNKGSLISITDTHGFENYDVILPNIKTIENTNNTTNNIATNDNVDQSDQFNGDFVYSGNSGSSKAALNNIINIKTERDIFPKFDGFDLKGKTRVDLSKGQDLVLSKRLESQKRKPRLVTTMPSASITPKLTQTDIKRRLVNMKFPIVIMGKDQLSSAVHVIGNDEAPQFCGLQEHIWPFMLEWYDNNSTIRKENTFNTNTKDKGFNIQRKNKSNPIDKSMNKLSKINKEQTSAKNTKPSNCIDKELYANSLMNKKIEEKKLTTLPVEVNSKLQQTKEQKPICQLRDKVLKLLYKKVPVQNVTYEDQKSGVQSNLRKNSLLNMTTNNKVDVSTDTQIVGTISNDLTRSVGSPPVLNKKSTIPKHPWAKAKWASDFIENVIKKIKNGVYYNQESRVQNRKSRIDSKETAIQTPSTSKGTSMACEENSGQLIEITPKDSTQEKQDPLKIIPGFENTLPALEINTLNMNQIAIKHCVTNIMVHFDVTVPTESHKLVRNLNNSLTLIPIEVSESQTKIFKCNTTILNAMLPAELCSILPEMIRNIIGLDIKLAIPPVPVNKTKSHLSTISELTHCDGPDLLKSFISPYICTSPELRSLLDGMFSKIIRSKYKINNIVLSRVGYDSHLGIGVLPELSANELYSNEADPIAYIISDAKQRCNLPSSDKAVNGMKISTCTSMQRYNALNQKLSPVIKHNDVSSIIKNICGYTELPIIFNMNSYTYDIRSLNLLFEKNSVTVNVSMSNDQGFKKNVALTIDNFKIDSLYKFFPKNHNSNECQVTRYVSNYPAKYLEYVDPHINEMDIKNCPRNHICVSNKVKRKGFGKLYKKCKSTSSISGERCTLLSKITNLDDFFQALGMGKPLSSVLDCRSEQKILTCLLQMKNWIAEINPSQALLVLLLANKKDTQNLVRFRPIILQGIAVNRITRANELDMEIEVIERENLNKLPRYEGISYIPASVENHDNLLEELCWIAKTTASDYQKPFDENSEKLLKSLLEKRKKLNPSYLRVMARYVGLGLLKSPKK